MRLRALRVGATLMLCAGLAAALGACGSGKVSAASLNAGSYSGTLPSGTPVNLDVAPGMVQVNGRDAFLVDPTTTAQFLVAPDKLHFYEWSCTMAEQGRSVHCDTWNAPRSEVTPTALPCLAHSGAPGWCGGAEHQAVDLLRICTTPGCS
jgi:hypothetical protein